MQGNSAAVLICGFVNLVCKYRLLAPGSSGQIRMAVCGVLDCAVLFGECQLNSFVARCSESDYGTADQLWAKSGHR